MGRAQSPSRELLVNGRVLSRVEIANHDDRPFLVQDDWSRAAPESFVIIITKFHWPRSVQPDDMERIGANWDFNDLQTSTPCPILPGSFKRDSGEDIDGSQTLVLQTAVLI